MKMMTEKEWAIGKQISKLRQKQGISLDQLCCGLCSNSTLSRIESNSREMEILFAIRIFQRLGYNPDVFELFGSQEEFDDYDKRLKILIFKRNGDISQFEQSLIAYQKNQDTKSEKNRLQKQFLIAMWGCFWIQKGDAEKAIIALEESISITVPSWENNWNVNTILGEDELEIMDQLADAYTLLGNTEKAFSIRRKISMYLDQRHIEKDQVAKLYSVILYKLAAYYLEQKQYEKSLAECERGLQLISRVDHIDAWPELLYWKGKCLHEAFKDKNWEVSRILVLEALKKAYYILQLFHKEDMVKEVKAYLGAIE